MTEITTPPGRIVWGHPFKSVQKTDNITKQPLFDAQGKPRMVWSFGVAFAAADFIAHIWPAMLAEAATKYAVNPQTGLPQTPPNFSWKYKDGTNGIDSKGKPYNIREGYNGCYVLNVSSELMAPPVYQFVNNAYVAINADQIKCGDFVVMGLKFVANVPKLATHTPGLYVNPEIIIHIGNGTEIIGQGADPVAKFGTAPQFALPPGATAIGAMPTNPGLPGLPGGMPMQAPAPMMPGQPQPGYPAPVAAPGGYPAPQPAPMPGQGYPQQPGGMPGMMPPR